MNSKLESQKFCPDNCSHRWMIRMLSEMSEYAMLNDLQDVRAAVELAQSSVSAAIDAYEQKITQSRNDALQRML